jgi:hypothetical protein
MSCDCVTDKCAGTGYLWRGRVEQQSRRRRARRARAAASVGRRRERASAAGFGRPVRGLGCLDFGVLPTRSGGASGRPAGVGLCARANDPCSGARPRSC